eukprot:CAMPEP_0204897674 /NCGR_PEP_ID=MMETSP1397-20131031/869_1 /ASSEMBLY_ACC=CAM_ASM_000891 /TAXON_ID=49980 /ORGANISM="Climacostomum Climacostomum virens, Strain Stock W-24" /LENGTH=860 /DNA_ID=CAMNT_0052065451 /DNA_START=87 /DNA_END=2668 /DNA_ORIENTATION=+
MPGLTSLCPNALLLLRTLSLVAAERHTKPPSTGVMRLMMQSRAERRIGSLKTYRGSLGNEAKDEYYESYRKLPKINQRNHFEHETENANIAYLNELQKRNLIPVPHGIVRSKGTESSINLRQRRMGDDYAKALGEGLAHIQSVETLDLKSNRLTESGSVTILSRLKTGNLQELNLSENQLGLKTFDLLVELLDDSKCKLKKLNLDSTGIKTNSVMKLCDVLIYNSSLGRLSLAKNRINETAARAIGNMLKANSTLKNLDLHWNQVRGPGMESIFGGLMSNNTLKVLDLSWNALGRQRDDAGVRVMSEALKIHKKLLHLDISHNNFSLSECKIIAEGLKENHTIYGIHADGNECSIDSRGFLIPMENMPDIEAGHFFKRILSSRGLEQTRRTNCWICERWVEVSFEWTPERSGLAKTDPIFIHLDCDGFQPDYMHKQGNTFRLTRAVPSGTLKFFFSHPTTPTTSDTYPKVHLKRPVEIVARFWEGCTQNLFLQDFNQIVATGQGCSLKDLLDIQPRIPNTYIPPNIARPKTPWSIPISLFKNYKFDSDDLYKKCFEFDWKCCKVPKLIKDEAELSAVKEILRTQYKYIKECYKFFSAIGSTGGIFSVGLNAYTDFVSQCGLLDSNFLLADLDFMIKSTLYNEVKNNPLNPANALVRYEFLEIIVRIALDKYYRKKIVDTPTEAVRKLLEEEMMPVLSKYDSNVWRWKRPYICEEVDLVLKAHKNILDAAYKRYSGRYDKPGKPKTMSLEEFQDICNQSGLVNETFVARNIDVNFNLSMMTQIDELSSRRHLQMSFVEFLEAFCRACDEANLPPSNFQGETESVSDEELRAQSLPKRIENAFPVLLRVCPASLQKIYKERR